MTQDPNTTVEPFEAFRDRVKPQVRPEQTLPRLRRALRVDDAFIAEYQALRPFLRPMLQHWPDALIAQLHRFPEPSAQLDAAAEAGLRQLLKAHALQLMSGNFDADYLDTLEDVALFLVHRNVKSIWLAGAYQQMTCEAIQLVFDRADQRHAPRRRQLITVLVSALALELNQIQRVFTLVERIRCEAALGGSCESDLPRAAATEIAPLAAPETLDLIQEVLIEIAPQSELMAKAFLKVLFEDAPNLRSYFEDDLAETERAVAAALSGLGPIVPDAAALAEALETLGRAAPLLLSDPVRRKALKAALTHTLKRAAGPRWGAQEETAFTELLRACSPRVGEIATRELRAQTQAERMADRVAS